VEEVVELAAAVIVTVTTTGEGQAVAETDKSIINREYSIERRMSLPSVEVAALSAVEVDSAVAVVAGVVALPPPNGNVFGWLPLTTVDLVVGSKKRSGPLAGS